MPKHAEQRDLPFAAGQLFDLVADIDRYPEFLPWCIGVRIREREGNVVVADLIAGFRMFREKFTSRVVLDREAGTIDVAYVRGPLRYLRNRWRFRDNGQGCTIDFDVDFEFRSRVLQGLIGVFFHEAFKRMVTAFEQRAHALYAPLALEKRPEPSEPFVPPSSVGKPETA